MLDQAKEWREKAAWTVWWSLDDEVMEAYLDVSLSPSIFSCCLPCSSHALHALWQLPSGITVLHVLSVRPSSRSISCCMPCSSACGCSHVACESHAGVCAGHGAGHSDDQEAAAHGDHRRRVCAGAVRKRLQEQGRAAAPGCRGGIPAVARWSCRR